MNPATEKFLAICTKHKVVLVSIGTKTNLIKSSKEWPFSHYYSAFEDGEEDGWPRIWRVCEEAGVSAGCGNYGQHQLRYAHGMELGVYRRHHQTWKKIT